MVERLRLPPSLFVVATLCVVLVGVLADTGYQGDHPAEAPPQSSRARLPVLTPDQWAFWDQMTLAFSAQPIPDALRAGPGAVFRWWFDSSYVGGDVIPRDYAGVALWIDEFERYGFEDGAAFVESRSGPCPLS